MANDDESKVRKSGDDDAPLDPALAARLRVAEAELRSHMDSGVWTTRRIMTLVLIVVIPIVIVIAIRYFAIAGGHHR